MLEKTENLAKNLILRRVIKIGNITGTRIYDLAESIVASGFAMKSEYSINEFEHDVICVENYILNFGCDVDKAPDDIRIGGKHVNRIIKLSNAKAGSGHSCALKGIIVNANFTFDQSFWQQFQRYHFSDIISSMSKQHRLLKMNLDNLDNVSDSIIIELKRMIELYNKCDDIVIDGDTEYSKSEYFERIIKSSPIGLELTARVTLNYLQLQTIYRQRFQHKMSDWHTTFVDWVKDLPLAKELIIGG